MHRKMLKLNVKHRFYFFKKILTYFYYAAFCFIIIIGTAFMGTF